MPKTNKSDEASRGRTLWRRWHICDKILQEKKISEHNFWDICVRKSILYFLKPSFQQDTFDFLYQAGIDLSSPTYIHPALVSYAWGSSSFYYSNLWRV